MSKKVNLEEIQKEIESYGYHLVKYNNANNVVTTDDEGYMYVSAIQTFRKGSKPRMLYHNPYSLYNLNRYLEIHSNGTVHVVSTEYVDCKSAIDIICDLHKDKGIQHTTAAEIVNSGRTCKYCSRARSALLKMDSHEHIISECNKHGLSVQKIYVGEDHHVHVVFICGKHKDKGVQDRPWFKLKMSSHWCRYCSGRDLTTEEFKKIVSEIHPNIEILGEYRKFEDHIDCKCTVCGHEWAPLAGQLKNKKRKRGCPICGRERTAKARRRSQKEIEELISSANPDIVVVGEYAGYHEPIMCKCLIHNTTFSANVCNLINRDANCPECGGGIGKSEGLVIQELSDLGFTVFPHYKFDDCRYKKVLEFDAYIPEYNTVVEYDGEQHYIPVKYFLGDEEKAMEKLRLTQIRDKVKDEYCAKNNIHMIRIPYWERKNIHDYLLSQFSKHNIIVPNPERLTGLCGDASA